MTASLIRATDDLNRRFFLDFPDDAAKAVETAPVPDILDAVTRQSARTVLPVFRRMTPYAAAQLLRALPEAEADRLLTLSPPPEAVRVLGHLAADDRTARLQRLEPAARAELETLMSYPADTAGRLMNTRVQTFRRDAEVRAVLKQLRKTGIKTARNLFIIDDDMRLVGKVAIQEAALAAPDTTLGALEKPIAVTVRPIDPIETITQAYEKHGALDVPVVDLDGVFLGAVTHDDLAETIQKDATADLQTMVGASKEERALSSPVFTVRKRMPWLQINLLTAFMAAAVVGMFEATIAQVTALAVLLPVVAGQSGNTGAQALAVTMRGLALREITIRQWPRVLRKEVIAGFLNGVGVAVTCGVGVFIWSQSLGLVAVIMSAMVLAMIAAGFAGALIPVILTRLGQDPATASSIILTTVTDIAGFFAFLGIATVLMQYL